MMTRTSGLIGDLPHVCVSGPCRWSRDQEYKYSKVQSTTPWNSLYYVSECGWVPTHTRGFLFARRRWVPRTGPPPPCHTIFLARDNLLNEEQILLENKFSNLLPIRDISSTLTSYLICDQQHILTILERSWYRFSRSRHKQLDAGVRTYFTGKKTPQLVQIQISGSLPDRSCVTRTLRLVSPGRRRVS